MAVIGGVKRKSLPLAEAGVHFFVLDLPHSDAMFVRAYPAETTEAFCDGHVSAFSFLGGVPQSIVYDNTRLAVAQDTGRRSSPSAHACSQSFSRTTCSRTGSDVRARATTRARSRVWSDTPGGTSWCPYLRSIASTLSTPTSRSDAWIGWRRSSGDTQRR